jgi:hypothetical protein
VPPRQERQRRLLQELCPPRHRLGHVDERALENLDRVRRVERLAVIGGWTAIRRRQQVERILHPSPRFSAT